MRSSVASKTNENTTSHSYSDQREKLNVEIIDCLYGLANITDEQSRKFEKLTGLSKCQALTIKAVSRSTSAQVSELARSMNINPATMVRILDRLEEQGLITRTRSKEDRRVVEIGLTDKAKDIGMILHNIIYDSMMHILVAKDNRELLNMLEVLQSISSLFGAAYLCPSELRDSGHLKGKQ